MSSGRKAGALLAALLGLALLYLVDPAGSRLIPPCPFRALSGLYCPGCGSLRALHRLLHGEVAAALRLNPLLALVLPFALASSAGDAVGRLRRNASPAVFASPFWGWGALAVILLFGVARNLPWHPFTLLAPR